MASDLEVVGTVLDNATAGDLVDAIARRIDDVPGARELVFAHRLRKGDGEEGYDGEEWWGAVHPGNVLLVSDVEDDEEDGTHGQDLVPIDRDRFPLEVLYDWSADHAAFYRELSFIRRDVLGVGPAEMSSKEIVGEARRRRRPDQTDRSMSLVGGFAVWLPETADGFHVEDMRSPTQSDLSYVAKYAAGRQGWADVRFDKAADECRRWSTRRISYNEELQVVALVALAEITQGFVDSSDAYWGRLVPAPPGEFLLRYTQTPR
jgi:hypothetical protein